ncbi:N-acyl-D-amino-acid deacylase family protein [Paraburkholderia sediminicola]|uniref:N-acyl-D-amino-acid deacylase family protein n=1 Tax=Paraburkholderia sediminicola TaxID=458836 RepID=UPI0038BAECC4
MVDCLIMGGTIVDGTGRPPYRSDLAINRDRIQILRDVVMPQAKRIVHAEGLAVAPGFIDIHSHNDLVAVMGARLNDKVSQGVTTEIFGNCGFSAFPVTSRNAHLTPDLMSLIAPRKLDLEQGVGWADWASFQAAVLEAGCQANVVGQVGHIMLRSAVMGMALRLPTAEELTEMKVLLENCLQQGASGLSFGLMYHPSSYAEKAEIQSLCQVAAEHGAVVSVHLRGYDVSTLISSMDELISVADVTGVRLQLSHLSPTGRDAQGLAGAMLDAIDRAVARGVDVALDRYPYEQGMSRLGLIFPKWVVSGGSEEMLRRLSSDAEIARMTPEIDSFVRPIGYDQIIINRNCEHELIGKSILDISRMMGLSPAAAAAKLMHDSEGLAGIVLTLSTMATQRRVIKHCLCMVGSDGMPSLEGTHPRTFGTFPRVLGPFVRSGILSIEEAIAKMTSLPARRFGLEARGEIQDDFVADLVLFDPAIIVDESTFDEPYCFASGIHEVFVGGKSVHRKGENLDVLPGTVLTGRVSRADGHEIH